MAVWILAMWLAFALFTTTLSAQDRCEYTADRNLTIPAAALNELDVHAGSGGLIVEGRSGAQDVRVSATLCASTQERLDALVVTLGPSGSRAIVDTEYPDWKDDWDNQYARIDLLIEVPAGMDVRLEDGSGGIEMFGVGALDIRDGSGHLDLEDISGDLDIRDGSGGVRVRGVQGDVRIQDGSGDIDVEDVTGSIRLSDGSGPVDIRGIGRDVIIDDKGSGTIDVVDVGGDLSVDGSRRERIRYRDVQGTVDLPPERRRRRGRGGA